MFDYKREYWNLDEAEINEKILKYWDIVYNMCKNSDINIVAHLDLYEKWGQLNKIDYSEQLRECLKVCKERGIATEINTAKRDPKCYHYPSDKFLKVISEYDIPVVLSADAHYPVHVTRNFEIAKKLFKTFNLKYTARFEKRKTIIEPVNF